MIITPAMSHHILKAFVLQPPIHYLERFGPPINDWRPQEDGAVVWKTSHLLDEVVLLYEFHEVVEFADDQLGEIISFG